MLTLFVVLAVGYFTLVLFGDVVWTIYDAVMGWIDRRKDPDNEK